MIRDKRFFGTWYGADYGNSGDQFFTFAFPYIEKGSPGSILSNLNHRAPYFRQLTKLFETRALREILLEGKKQKCEKCWCISDRRNQEP